MKRRLQLERVTGYQRQKKYLISFLIFRYTEKNSLDSVQSDTRISVHMY